MSNSTYSDFGILEIKPIGIIREFNQDKEKEEHFYDVLFYIKVNRANQEKYILIVCDSYLIEQLGLDDIYISLIDYEFRKEPYVYTNIRIKNDVEKHGIYFNNLYNVLHMPNMSFEEWIEWCQKMKCRQYSRSEKLIEEGKYKNLHLTEIEFEIIAKSMKSYLSNLENDSIGRIKEFINIALNEDIKGFIERDIGYNKKSNVPEYFTLPNIELYVPFKNV